jgi:hypothetical protein
MSHLDYGDSNYVDYGDRISFPRITGTGSRFPASIARRPRFSGGALLPVRRSASARKAASPTGRPVRLLVSTAKSAETSSSDGSKRSRGLNYDISRMYDQL